MNRRALLWAVMGVLGLGSAIGAVMSVKARRLGGQVQQLNQAAHSLESELEHARTEVKGLKDDQEKLHADTMTYLSLNAKLQAERDRLQQESDGTKKVVKEREDELARVKQSLTEAQGKLTQAEATLQGAGESEQAQLAKRVQALEATLRQERATYHYNLGVAYTQAKHYREAVEALEAAVRYDPANAEAHYNLGLLYQEALNDPLKAVLHYRKYVELSPAAADRPEVEARIRQLQ